MVHDVGHAHFRSEQDGSLRARARVRRCPRKVPSLRSGQSDESGCNAMHLSHPHLQTHSTQFASGRGIMHNSCCQRLTWSSWSFGGPPWPPAADARSPTADPRSPDFVRILCILPRALPCGQGPPSSRPGPSFLLDVLSPCPGELPWGAIGTHETWDAARRPCSPKRAAVGIRFFDGAQRPEELRDKVLVWVWTVLSKSRGILRIDFARPMIHKSNRTSRESCAAPSRWGNRNCARVCYSYEI